MVDALRLALAPVRPANTDEMTSTARGTVRTAADFAVMTVAPRGAERGASYGADVRARSCGLSRQVREQGIEHQLRDLLRKDVSRPGDHRHLRV